MNAPPTSLRIGTRGSDLALWQARHAANLFQARGVAAEIIIIKTLGDLDQQSKFTSMGGKGVFVKEIEEALLDGRVDVAVHSLKDLPTVLPAGLALAAVLEREVASDALVTATPGMTLEALPAGARIATGSLRRVAQVKEARPDLDIVPLRGNVPTRVEKILAGTAEATIMAYAGLVRLGLQQHVTQLLPVTQFVPPMGQGAVALETRAGFAPEFFASFNDDDTRLAVDAERAFLRRLGGGCNTPAGVHAYRTERSWGLSAMLGLPDGSELLRAQERLSPEEADAPDAAARLNARAEAVADRLLAQASPELRRLTQAYRPEPGDGPT